MSSPVRPLLPALAGLLLAGTVVSGSQPPEEPDSRPGRLEAYFEGLVAERGFQGGAILARAGEVLWEGAYGKADLARDRKLDEDSVYELASVGKGFTAMAVLTLVKAGDLDLEDRVEDLLDPFPFTGITIRNLLDHTSGIPSYTDVLELEELPESFDTYMTNRDVLAWLAGGTDALLFETGSAFSYSDTNYVLLAMIVERISGRPFADYLADEVFKPLGMHSTFSYTERFREGVIPEGYAFGYVRDEAGNLVLPETLPGNEFLPALSTLEGDGTCAGSLRDFAAWERAWTTDRLLPEELRVEALSPARLSTGELSNYGFGWSIDGEAGLVYHWGGWPGYLTGVYLDPSTRTIFAYAITVPFEDWSWLEEVRAIVFE